MSFDRDAGQSLAGHGMDEAARVHLNHVCISFKDVCGTGKSQISFDEVTLDKATEYAAEDSDVTLRLWRLFTSHIDNEGANCVHELVDRPIVAVTTKMDYEVSQVAR